MLVDRQAEAATPLLPDAVTLPGTPSHPPAVPVPPAASGRWPSPPDHGPARALRRLIGIREELLDLTADERPRYTKYAFIVLNTGLLAAVSMGVAVRKVVPGAPLLGVLAVALIWGWLILTLDGFLVSCSHGVFDLRSKLVLLLPRLAVALVVGLVIAEPLVLQIFQPTIRDQINATNSSSYDTEIKLWEACNPVDPTTVDRRSCAGHILPVTSGLQSLRDQLSATSTQLVTQQKELDGLQAQFRTLVDKTDAECNGDARTGTTGVRGKGPACDADTAAQEQFRTDQRLAGRAAELATLRTQQADLTAAVQKAAADHAAAVDKGAVQKAEQYRRDHSGVGLLDEDKALGKVSANSFFVFAGVWLVRLLVLLLDCMPILVKFMGGPTSYDAILAEQLRSNVVRAGTRRRLDERGITVHQEVEIYRREQDAQAAREEIDAGYRLARARRNADLEDQINQLAEQYLSQSRWSAARSANRPGRQAG
ncbi:DUF4407 domain-containing protein [Kitasatospora sp. McL0602]|uniref:DUF4407 domain-containing protein n=1 Tax=Kitasatospora sp. McL0602 TaxID=3439530 RepID=UPI003F895782